MLKSIIEKFHQSRNIKEKRELSPILQRIKENGYQSSQIYSSIGEDAAAIIPSPDSSHYILLTTDALLPLFIEKSPFGAGFSAVYVGIDDIMASGGVPMAFSTTVAYSDPELGDKIFEGILRGSQVFQVPLVRGHTTTDSPHNQLTATMLGICQKEDFISYQGMKVGDFIALIWDSEGKPAQANPNYWDTITMKNSKEFYAKRSFFSDLKHGKLIHSCKDISNGGILGTLYQLLSYATKGAELNLDLLHSHLQQLNFPYSLEQFLFLFLTSSFLITASKDSLLRIKESVKQSNMQICELGTVITKNHIELGLFGEKKVLMDHFD